MSQACSEYKIPETQKKKPIASNADDRAVFEELNAIAEEIEKCRLTAYSKK